MSVIEYCFFRFEIALFNLGAGCDVARVTDNPADQLVAALNDNRTAKKESALYDNPGLGCIALQYIKAYQGDCSVVGGDDAKKPFDSQFADTNGKRNSSFTLEGGEAKITKPGCFSGANDVCSSANDWPRSITLWSYIATVFIAAAYAFGL
ncbi:hypothetical protein POTOM_026147 [Populus tomentosa]|uniref:Uncharacterized protein n=1 Tax=Populus tomentosa TaxID=118781 RepID=A0A8X8CZ68_POPTO|nr:hypothetical protein POTOM_026147 [Populus tomentosa]